MYLPGGAFFGAVSLLSFAVFEFVVVGFPLLDEDLKAATAISQKKNTQLSIKMQRQKEGIFSLNLNLRERHCWSNRLFCWDITASGSPAHTIAGCCFEVGEDVKLAVESV